MNDAVGGFIRAATLDELRDRRRMVVSTPGGAVLIAAEGDDVVALDNRCPHMGFPLHRGSIARLPRGDDPTTLAPAELRRGFLDACDRQQQVAEAARLAADHIAAGHPPADFIALLGHALLREDASFHMVQNLQAAVRQYLAWEGDQEASPILIAAARYLAAHSPTLRARHQTAQVARRLMRGGALHEDGREAEI